jgi:hypothetical protein
VSNVYTELLAARKRIAELEAQVEVLRAALRGLREAVATESADWELWLPLPVQMAVEDALSNAADGVVHANFEARTSTTPEVPTMRDTASRLPPGGLTTQERLLLEWLSKEESSAYGECNGDSLNLLVNTGLAQYSRTPPSDYDGVSLTAAGHDYLANLRARAADGGSNGDH